MILIRLVSAHSQKCTISICMFACILNNACTALQHVHTSIAVTLAHTKTEYIKPILLDDNCHSISCSPSLALLISDQLANIQTHMSTKSNEEDHIRVP